MDSQIANGINNISNNTISKTNTTKTLGKDDFMKMLVAQLQNQDPLKPLDGTDFAAQLAQFSSLEQLTNVNTELKNVGLNQMAMNYSQSVNLIGKNVVTNSGNSITANGSSIDLNYKLAKDAQSVTISIFSKDGKLVKSWDETAQKAGMNKVTWDCSDVDKGDYTFRVVAKDAKGQAVSVETMTAGLVTAVHFRNNQILVTVNGKEVPLSNIIEVNQLEAPLSDMIGLKPSGNLLDDVLQAKKIGKIIMS
jgi:flagellar basal-body rod modification protein FlgD